MTSIMFKLARGMALLGGAVLVVLIAMTCISIAGRLANTLAHAAFVQTYLPFVSSLLLGIGVGPVQGDFELVEAGIAFAIFAFLPWCQLMNAHATVDLLAPLYSKTGNRVLTFLWEVLLAVVIVVITWRLMVGMSDKMRYGETTFILQFPIWWAYAASAFAASVAALVALYVAVMRFIELMSGEARLPAHMEADH